MSGCCIRSRRNGPCEYVYIAIQLKRHLQCYKYIMRSYFAVQVLSTSYLSLVQDFEIFGCIYDFSCKYNKNIFLYMNIIFINHYLFK